MRRIRNRPLAAVLLAALQWAALPPAAVGAATAEAVHSANPETIVTTEVQPNLVLAATSAMHKCESTFAGPGYCELTRLDGRDITTAKAIKARVPQSAHPLFLWRYRSPTATVYLAGSIHILKQGLYPLPPQFMAALQAADNLVLEIDVSQYTPQQLQAKTLQFARLDGGRTLREALDADLYARLDAQATRYGLQLAQIGSFKPAFVTQQLTMLALMSVGYDPALGLEQYFTQRAVGKRILEMESMDLQLDLLLNQRMPVQVQMVEDTLDQLADFEPLTADLVTAWLSGDDALFETAFAEQSGTSQLSAEFLEQLMDDRNVDMAEAVTRYLAANGTYLVLVGAAHFIGENGIIALLDRKQLQRQGIEGRRIFSNEQI